MRTLCAWAHAQLHELLQVLCQELLPPSLQLLVPLVLQQACRHIAKLGAGHLAAEIHMLLIASQSATLQRCLHDSQQLLKGHGRLLSMHIDVWQDISIVWQHCS